MATMGSRHRHNAASYPLEPLAEAVGWPVPMVAAWLDVSPLARLTEEEADHAAVKLAKRHPFDVWPEMVEHVIADCSVTCARRGCEQRFIPGKYRPGQRFCSSWCRTHVDEPTARTCARPDCTVRFMPEPGAWKQRYCSARCRSTQAARRDRRKAGRRAYHRERMKAYYAANRERLLEQQRRRDARRRQSRQQIKETGT